MQVCMGAMMQCSFGVAPSSLVVLPKNMVFTDQVPDANIMDHVPLVNIMPFGMCTSLANPTVAAATALASVKPSSLLTARISNSGPAFTTVVVPSSFTQ